MAKKTDTPAPDLDQVPAQGGSYTRDPQTGALTRTEGPADAKQTPAPASPSDQE